MTMERPRPRMDSLKKLIVDLDPNSWHGHTAETLWAEPLTDTVGLFRLRSSPFFSRIVSFGDTVRATPSEDGFTLKYGSTFQNGGHSTYMLVMNLENEIYERYWEQLAALGCTFESAVLTTSQGRRELYSVDIPPTVDIRKAYAVFELGEAEGAWIFQEGHVGHKV